MTHAEEKYAAYLRGAGPSPPLPDAEPDVDVLMNLGDVLLRRAECLHENGAAPPDIDAASVSYTHLTLPTKRIV